jgi:hypothetical protein
LSSTVAFWPSGVRVFGLGHLEPEVVALARALADAAEHREAALLDRGDADQLLDEHRLADACAAEQADLAALGERAQQVDDLDAGLEDLGDRLLLFEGRRGAVDRQRGTNGRRLCQCRIGHRAHCRARHESTQAKHF